MLERRAQFIFAHYFIKILLMAGLTFWFPGIQYTIIPMESSPLTIITAPLLHADWNHLFSNLTLYIPMIFLISVTFKNTSLIVYYSNYLISGLLVWIAGDYAAHIGISGVAIGLFFINLLAGICSLNAPRVLMSMCLSFYYYAVATDFYVGEDGISTDYHICGFLSALSIITVIYYPGTGLKFR